MAAAQPTQPLPSALPSEGPAGETVASIAQAQAISADEIALYDRQIRLWGVKAQEKIRTANILLIGMGALANEVAKNLVLAGIGSLTILDHKLVTEEDLGAQFLVSDDDLGKSRAEAAAANVRKLNPRVQVYVDTRDVSLIGEDQLPTYVASFTLIIATDTNFNITNTLNAAARVSQRPFYAAGVHGIYGYIFADLISHTFVIEREKSNVPTRLHAETATRTITAATTKKESGKLIELVTKREIYTPLLLATSSPLPPEYLRSRRRLRHIPPLLTCLRALFEFEKSGRDPHLASHADLADFTRLATATHEQLQLPKDTLRADFLRRFLQNLAAELAPVAAFLGGQLAQDVINVLGRREQPIQNLLLFDADASLGVVYPMHPIFEDGAGVVGAPGLPPAPGLDGGMAAAVGGPVAMDEVGGAVVLD